MDERIIALEAKLEAACAEYGEYAAAADAAVQGLRELAASGPVSVADVDALPRVYEGCAKTASEAVHRVLDASQAIMRLGHAGAAAGETEGARS